MTFARATLAGVVASAPEKRFTNNNTAVTSFMLQITPPARGNAEPVPYLIKVTCWARLAETVAESVQQGQMILAEGRLLAQTETLPDGNNKKSFEIEAGQVSVVSGQLHDVVPGAGMVSASGSNYSPAPSAAPAPQPAMTGASSAPAPQSSFTEDDIPF